MQSLNNKKLIITISLILAFTIVFNIGVKAYADIFVMGGIAIKVFSTILASMGILTYANSKTGGVSEFWNGFKEYTENIKGVQNVVGLFATQGIRTFTGKVKMSVSDLISMIKEYYLTLKPADIPVELPELVGGHLDDVFTTGSSITRLYNSMQSVNSYDLGSGYILIVTTMFYQGNDGAKYNQFRYQYETLKDGIRVNTNSKTTKQAFPNDVRVNDAKFGYIDHRIQLSGTTLNIANITTNITDNKVISNSISFEFPELVGLVKNPDLPNIKEVDYPIPLSVPDNIPFLWQLELEKLGSISGVIGKTIEELIQSINDVPVQNYIDDLLDIPKKIIDSYPIPEIVTTPEGIITDIKVPAVDLTYPEIVEQTGLLGAIALGIENIKDLLNDLVLPKEIESLDFSPLQNIAVTDRFPFSLPWDLKNSISLLVAPPVAPVFNVPMVTEEIVIDLNEFETLAKISRSMLSIIFVVGLIITTRRFIGGA